MPTLTHLAREARLASLRAGVERDRAIRLAARHTGTDAELLELYRASDAAAEVESDAWVRLLIACQRADGTFTTASDQEAASV